MQYYLLNAKLFFGNCVFIACTTSCLETTNECKRQKIYQVVHCLFMAPDNVVLLCSPATLGLHCSTSGSCHQPSLVANCWHFIVDPAGSCPWSIVGTWSNPVQNYGHLQTHFSPKCLSSICRFPARYQICVQVITILLIYFLISILAEWTKNTTDAISQEFK